MRTTGGVGLLHLPVGNALAGAQLAPRAGDERLGEARTSRRRQLCRWGRHRRGSRRPLAHCLLLQLLLVLVGHVGLSLLLVLLPLLVMRRPRVGIGGRKRLRSRRGCRRKCRRGSRDSESTIARLNQIRVRASLHWHTEHVSRLLGHFGHRTRYAKLTLQGLHLR